MYVWNVSSFKLNAIVINIYFFNFNIMSFILSNTKIKTNQINRIDRINQLTDIAEMGIRFFESESSSASIVYLILYLIQSCKIAWHTLRMEDMNSGLK